MGTAIKVVDEASVRGAEFRRRVGGLGPKCSAPTWCRSPMPIGGDDPLLRHRDSTIASTTASATTPGCASSASTTVIINRVVDAHHGYVVETQARRFHGGFGSPADAVGAAVDVQRASLTSRPGSRLDPVRVRIGCAPRSRESTATTTSSARTWPAARVAGQADGEEILISDAVFDDLGGSVPVVQARDDRAEGHSGDAVVHAIDWAESVR